MCCPLLVANSSRCRRCGCLNAFVEQIVDVSFPSVVEEVEAARLRDTSNPGVSERMDKEIAAVEHIILPERWKRAGGKLDLWDRCGF